jgi:hypothetical protein
MALLTALDISEDASVWSDLGFDTTGGRVWVSGVEHRFGDSPGDPITGWTLFGLTSARSGDIDGLKTVVVDDPAEPVEPQHANGVIGLDHVVVSTPDHARTIAALEAAGLTLLRTRETEKVRQGFFRLGPVILEVVGGTHDSGDGPAAFLGLAWTCADLDATAEFLGDRLRPAKDAVQPGRQIATLDNSAGSRVAMAFMSPAPRR